MPRNGTTLNNPYQAGGAYAYNKDNNNIASRSVPTPSAGYGDSSSAAAVAGPYGYGGAGYGGYNNISNSTGMRRRAGNADNNSNSYNPYQMEEETKVHGTETIQTQMQKRRQAFQTQSRLESAKMAEKTLADLTTMFS